MQDSRFAPAAQIIDWPKRATGRAPQAAAENAQLRAKYRHDWTIVKRARFNAAKRFERKQDASVLAFAVAGICGFLVPYCTLQFEHSLAPHTKSVLDFSTQTAGMLSLIIGLIEQARDFPAQARRLDKCGRDVNKVLRRLSLLNPVESEELGRIVAAYEHAIDECVINHDDIDRGIAEAEEDLRHAKDARKAMHASEAAASAAAATEADAMRRLSRLKWQELAHIYWLYATIWFAPIALGVVMWFWLAPAPAPAMAPPVAGDPITTGSLPDASRPQLRPGIEIRAGESRPGGTAPRGYDLLDEIPAGLSPLSGADR